MNVGEFLIKLLSFVPILTEHPLLCEVLFSMLVLHFKITKTKIATLGEANNLGRGDDR